MPKKSLRVFGRYVRKRLSDGFIELSLCSGFGASQAVFHFAPHQFDGVEIGTVGGLVMQFDSRIVKQFLDRFRFVRG